MKHNRKQWFASAPVWIGTVVLGLELLTATGGVAQVVVPGLGSDPIAEAWVEAELLVLRTEGGRLYSVPLQSVTIESLPTEPTEGRHIPLLSEILELLDAGVSEPTIQAYMETTKEASTPYEITAEALIVLKNRGASESFIQYLIHYGRSSPKTTYITWTGPQWPPRERDPGSAALESPATENPEDHAADQEGIPLVPYVFSGFGACCPVYPIQPTYPGETPGGSDRQPSRPGYYWPQARSIMGRTRLPDDGLRPEPHPSRRNRGGQLIIRWTGPMQTRGPQVGSPASDAPSRVTAPLTSSPIRRIGGTPSSGGARNVGAPSGRSSGTRSLMGNKTSRPSGRSLTKKN